MPKKGSIINEYNRERNRIKRAISRAQKRGYIFADDVIPDKPKRITQASVNRLAKLTTKKLYEKAEYVSEETHGEIIGGLEGRKLERTIAATKAQRKRKSKFSGGEVTPSTAISESNDFVAPFNVSEDKEFFDRVVISQWKSNLDNYIGGEAYNLLKSWLDNTIRTEGEHNTAVMLEEGAAAGHIITWETVYKGDNAISYAASMIEYLPDEGLIYKHDVLDDLEYMASLGDALEQEEDWELPN